MRSIQPLLVFLSLLFCTATASIRDGLQQQTINQPGFVNIPALGLGLWNSRDKNATNAINYAFNSGYRHLDSAAAYRNEKNVGAAISNSSLPRTAYWVTSKLWNDAHRPHLVRPALEKTLSDLQLPYLDLYLMHWPVSFGPGSSNLDNTSILATWAAMESLVAAGLTRYIGISNFAPDDVSTLLANCTIKPYAHEFETHPYLQQADYVYWHQLLGIRVIAYSPLANMNPIYDGKSRLPPILEDAFWVKLAAKKNVTPAQAILGWGMVRGTSVIPKSVHEARIVENRGSMGIGFSAEEMDEIAGQDKKVRFNNPSKSWKVKLFKGLDDGS